MANPKAKTKPNKKRWWLIIAGLVVLASVIYLAVDLYRDHQDREKFKRLGVAAESINNQLTANYELEVMDDQKYCHYTEQKWQEGPLICSVSYTYAYSGVDYRDVYDWFANKDLSVIHEITRLDDSSVAFSIDDAGTLCSVRLSRDDFKLRCADPARTAHYPLSSR